MSVRLADDSEWGSGNMKTVRRGVGCGPKERNCFYELRWDRYSQKYSVLCAQDERGSRLKEARIEGHCRQDYARFFGALEGPSRAVLEACWNWGLTHDLLEEIEEVEEVVLAHPLKTRLIADGTEKGSVCDSRFFLLAWRSQSDRSREHDGERTD